jgi:hypothetical protein
VLNENARVFHDGKTGCTRLSSDRGVRDALLKPEDLCADGNGGISDRRNLFGPSKNIDDVNGLRNVLEAGESFDAQNL